MSAQTTQRHSRIGRAFAMMGAAISASAAIENGRRPARRDLDTLGIDPNAFDRIG